jgi:PAS domain S-box-containing protein
MRDEDKTKKQLVSELEELRRRVAALEGIDTERKRAEDTLRQSEEKHRGLLDACPDAIVMSDLNGRILFASRPTWGLLALADSDELVGRSVRDCVTEGDRGRLAANMARLAETGVRRNTEYTALRSDGTTIPTEVSSAVIRDADGRPKAVMAVIRDISARKKADEALRQSLDELRAIDDSMGDGLLIADGQTLRLVRANQSICSLLGYSEDELLSLAIADLHPKEALPAILAGLQAGIVGRLPDAHDVPMTRKDGSVFYVDITGNTLTYRGRPCSLGVFRDVTQRREAQAALERERRTLQHMLRASDHERQLIAYDIHDGLAQQLAGALMQFQVYEHLKATKPDEAQTAFGGAVMLLRQSHLEARRLISGVRPPILDESGVVAAIAHLVHDPAFDQGPKIDFRSRVTFHRLAPVLENVIYRIVQEGLTNARNHSKSKTIRLGLVERGDRLRIEMRDWGVGFDPKTSQENRFGLEGTRERARLLGGKCSITSKPAAGTSIIVELPLVEREGAP